MPRSRRNRQLDLVRGLVGSAAARRMSRTSRRDREAAGRSAEQALQNAVGRRFVRYRQPRQATGSRYQVLGRRNTSIAVGQMVGMAH